MKSDHILAQKTPPRLRKVRQCIVPLSSVPNRNLVLRLVAE